jgi:hypothetical protein
MAMTDAEYESTSMMLSVKRSSVMELLITDGEKNR